MNYLRNIIGLALVGFCLACQSNKYKINGTAKELKNGDIVYLTTDMNTGSPKDSAVVNDGMFVLEGTAKETPTLCIVYAKNDQSMSKPLFIEEGNISLTLSKDASKTKVYGTFCNNKWQEMSDSVERIAKRINLITNYVYENKLEPEEQAAEIAKAQKLGDDVNKYVLDLANKNIDNEFGYFLVTYNSGSFSPKDHLVLLKKLPSDKRKRPELLKLEKELMAMMKLEVGSTIETFTVNDINGKPVDILKEAANHKITIIDFWASWCGPCRQEMPNVVGIYAEYKDKGLGIIGISLDNNANDWKQAVKDLGMKWVQVSDLSGWHSDAAARLGVNSIPMTYIVDSKGKIIAKGLRGSELKAFVEKEL